MKFELKQVGDWSYYYFPELEQKNICHGFFTIKSPSGKLKGRDKTLFFDIFGLKDAVVMRQEHGDKVHVVRNGDKPASGDGIILIKKGVAGIIKTADCLPIIICDPDFPMASITHAGWRGSAKKITHKTIDKMVKLGAKTGKMIALLGPSINSCCYEVGEDVYTAFLNEGFPERIFQKTGRGSFFLNIRQTNIELIKDEGIKEIYDIDICTFCSKDLFNSYRRGETEKRQINFVSLME